MLPVALVFVFWCRCWYTPPAVDGTEPRTRTRVLARQCFIVLLPVWPVLGAGTCPVALDKGMKFVGALSAQAHTMLALPTAE